MRTTLPRMLPIQCIVVLLLAWRLCEVAVAQTPANLPETTPWDFKQLSKPPTFEWADKTSTVRSLYYAGEPYQGKPTRVFAYYATPGTLKGDTTGDQELPAVVLIHGGGGTAFREWAELWAKRGYAAIAMDTAGFRPIEGKNAHQKENRERLKDGGPDQGDNEKFGSIDKPPSEQWPYHAVAAAVRAHSLIRSFPEIDAQRTAVTGISWGGYLTCIVAGIDNRFQAAVPVYGCGFLQDNSAWVSRLEKMTPEQRQRWITLWDPSNYLPSVSMPILFVNGTNDFAYPLDSYLKSFHLVQSEKQLRVTVNMPHGHQAGWAPQEIGLFIDQHLLDGPALPVVYEPRPDNVQIYAKCTSSSKLKSAALHYTTDSGAINKRTWKSLPGSVAEDSLKVPLPPPDATIWFITVTDDREVTVSSSVKIKQSP